MGGEKVLSPPYPCGPQVALPQDKGSSLASGVIHLPQGSLHPQPHTVSARCVSGGCTQTVTPPLHQEPGVLASAARL